MTPDPLDRLKTLTRDYARVPQTTTGLLSLGTGLFLGALGSLTFLARHQRFLDVGRGGPERSFLLFLVRNEDPFPAWFLTAAFTLPLFWGLLLPWLRKRIYPHPFGMVRPMLSPTTLALRPFAQFLGLWGPLLLLGTFTLVRLIALPVLYDLLDLKIPAFPAHGWLPLLLAAMYVPLATPLELAERNEVSLLIYLSGLLLMPRGSLTAFLVIPFYGVMSLLMIAFGLWAHLRYRRALSSLDKGTGE